MVDQTHDERLDQLLTTAASVFAEKGFHPTTMRDLARATGMSLAGMYHYVPSKEDLLYLIQRGCFEQVAAGAREAIHGVPEPTERLRHFIRHHVTFFAGHMAEMKVLSHEADSLTGEKLQTIQDLKRRYVELLTGIISATAGWSGPDPKIAALSLFGMMNWIYTWYHPGGRLSADELAEQITMVFLHGVLHPAPTTRGG